MRWFVVISAIPLVANGASIGAAQDAPMEKMGSDAQPHETAAKGNVPKNDPGPPRNAEEFRKQQERIMQWSVDRFARSAPAEYATYQKALSGNSEIDTARAAIQLAHKARDLAAKSPKESFSTTAWMQCLKVLKNAKSKEAQQLILDEWNDGLAREDECLLGQLDAAPGEYFDRRLLSPGFWKLLDAPKKLASMSAACSLLYSAGDRDDANRLDKILHTMAETDKCRPLMLGLIDCFRYRLSGANPDYRPVPNWLQFRSDPYLVPL